jgi:D-aminoacyl-tRNA deacylase
MRVVVQRVSSAGVSIDGKLISQIGPGMLLLVAAGKGDVSEQVRWMADKISGLRIFPDENDKMNLGIDRTRGEILVVSQFTLYGDCRKGKRPSYADSAPPDEAEKIYDEFVAALKTKGLLVKAGVFGAMMMVNLINDGPVTLIIDAP